ncbi:MAG: hypothetical protein HY714_00920 [Candidatus Omnitrophica bacterium]|nr:hypothetical protein [Candidatus Omnitrophota bacterium]
MPLIPLALAAAYFSKKNWPAYVFAALLVGLKMALTSSFSPVYAFIAAGLFAGIYAARRIRPLAGTSVAGIAGTALLAVVFYEIAANVGVWAIGGCVAAGEPPLYSMNVSGLAECFRASVPYSAVHFLRDIPLSVLVVKVTGMILGTRTKAAVSSAHGLRQG